MASRSFSVFLFLALGLAFAPPVGAANDDSDVPITLEQCRDQLAVDFNVMDLRRENRPMPHIAKQFSKIVDEVIARKGTKDHGKAKDRFDNARANLLERIIDGRWGLDEASEDILTDCFFAVHPEADVEN